MAVNLPLASEDPYLLNLNAPPTTVDPNSTFDPTQTVQNPLDTGALPTDASLSGDTGVSAPQLSGDAYAPADQGVVPATPPPFIPMGQQGGQPGGFDPFSQDNVANTAIGESIYTSKQAQMPQAQAPLQTGPPPSTFGNDFAGSILSAERQLPGGTNTQAFIHGAQSQTGGLLGGFLLGAAGGALAGSVVPVVGTAIGGLVGGLIGYYIGSQVQDQVGKGLASSQTLDALKVQTDYEQKNAPIAWAVGQIAPALLAFRPNPEAMANAFRLIGRSVNIRDIETFKNLYMTEENAPAVNALMMMAFGTGQTAVQYKQQVDAGDVNPVILAINLVGMSALSGPRAWLGKLAPGLRAGAEQAHSDLIEEEARGMAEVPPGSSAELVSLGQAQGNAFQEFARLDPTSPEGQAKLEEVRQLGEQMKALQDKEQPIPEQVAPQADIQQAAPEAAPETPATPVQTDPIAHELIDDVRTGNKTPEEADSIAAQQRIPNWESLVAKRDAQQQAQQQGGAQQLRDLAQNPAFSRQPAVSPQEHLNALRQAAPKVATTPDELRASIAKNQAKTQEMQKAAFDYQRKQAPGEYLGGSADEQITNSQNLPDHTKTVLKRLLGKKPEVSKDQLPDSLNVAGIKSLVSETRVERGGETRAVAELDPSLIPTLGKNMYSGDIGKIAVKEGIQNAIDSMRGVTNNGESHMSIILRDNGVSLKDNGRGMTPEVATKELVDIGGSFGKDVSGSSGGWGLAKVALFSNAKDIDIHTIARRPDGQVVETHLSGSGLDWADKNKGLRVETIEHPTGMMRDSVTGTTIDLTFNDGVRYNSWNASSHVSATIDYMNTREPIGISLSGVGVSRDTILPPIRDRYDHMTTLDGWGAKVDIYANPSYAKHEYSIPVKVLNNGIYQFDMHVTLPDSGSLEMPGNIVMDIHAKGSPKEDDYPWETNRESVRPALREQMEKYITSTLIHDAAKKQADTIKKAISEAPKINNGRFRVVDTFGKTDPDSIKAVQSSEAVDAYMRVASRSFTAFKGGVSNQGPELYGVSLSGDHLGVSIHASAGGPGRLRNYVLLNPFMIFEEVGRGGEDFEAPIPLDSHPIEYWNAKQGRYELPNGEIIIPDDVEFDSVGNKMPLGYSDADFAPNGEFIGTPHSAEGRYNPRALPEVTQDVSNKIWAQRTKQFAARTISTLIHEYAHEDARGHDESFAGVLTRAIDKNMDDAYNGANALTRHLSKNNYEGIKQIAELYRTHFSGRMGGNEVFRNISTGLAATTPQRGIPEGYPETSASSGGRSSTALRTGASTATPRLAPGPDLRAGESGFRPQEVSPRSPQDTHINHLGEPADRLPRVKPGFTRLYRGIFPGGDQLPNINDEAGRWFASDPQEARNYGTDKGTLTYVDVPNRIAEAADRAQTLGGDFPQKLEYILPREWASRAVDVLKPKGVENGLQPKTTGEQETSGQAGVGGETSLGSKARLTSQISPQDTATGTEGGNEAGNASQLTQSTEGQTAPDLSSGLEGQPGGAIPSALRPPPIGAGAIRPNAGNGNAAESIATNVANVTGRGNAAASRRTSGNATTPDYSATTRATRDIQAAQRGATNAEHAAQDGTTGWASSSDVEDKLRQDVQSLLEKWNVDWTQAPQYRGRVRMSDDEYGTLFDFTQKPNNDTTQGQNLINRATLFIPDDPRLLPSANMAKAQEWPSLTATNKLVDLIRVHEKGDPSLEYIPTNLNDDASRVALIIKGWPNRFYFDNSRAYPDTLNWDGVSPGAKTIWSALQPALADGSSVVMNARGVITHFSALEAGVFRNKETGEKFDPAIYQRAVQTGIRSPYKRLGDSIENLTRASRGLTPESAKVEDMAGAQMGEERGPIDLWFARLGSGINNVPTTKLYDYAFGRNNFLTRMFSSFEHIGIDGNPAKVGVPHIHSAQWVGYQEVVSERLAAIKQAAFATGDPKMINMAKAIRSNLVSKDLAEVFRDTYGLTPGSKPPILAFDKVLATDDYLNHMSDLSERFFSSRFLKGKLLGNKTDVQETQGHYDFKNELLKPKYYRLRRALANYYRDNFYQANVGESGTTTARQRLDQNLTPIAKRMAEVAFTHEYGGQYRGMINEVRVLLEVGSPSQSEVRQGMKGGGELSSMLDIEKTFAPVVQDMHKKFELPDGLVGVNIYYGGNRTGIANYRPEQPNQINLNARLFRFLTIIRDDQAPMLARQLAQSDLKGYALEKAKRVIFDMANGDDVSAGTPVLAHEMAHKIQHIIHGESFDLEGGQSDSYYLPIAHSLLEHMTPKYMNLLVKEGLGNQLETILQAHSSSINDYLGGNTNAPVQGRLMSLEQAIDNIVEHQADQWAIFHKMLPYSHVTPEVFRRNVYEPEIAEASAQELGKSWEKALKPLHDALAVEAETQLSGRGPSPEHDPTVLEPEEVGAGVPAYARLPEGSAFQSGSSGWLDAAAAHQNIAERLTTGEQALNIKATADALRAKMTRPEYKPNADDRATLNDLDASVNGLKAVETVVRQWPTFDPRLPQAENPWLQRATTQAAARVQRQDGEGQAAYALRMVKASGAYADLNHALEVAKSARDGAFIPVQYGDKVGFKVNNRFYVGTPGDHVANWSGGFHEAIHNLIDNVPDGMLSGEPEAQSIIGIHPHDLGASFADEFRPADPNVRVGAVSITGKAGEEIRIPSFPKHAFQFSSNANDVPIPKLSPGAAANKVAAHFEEVADSIAFDDELEAEKPFDPEQVITEFDTMKAAGEGQPPPIPPLGGGGEEPPIDDGGKPSKGLTSAEKAEAKQKAAILQSADVLSGFTSAIKDGLKIEDPGHRSVVSGIVDVAAQALQTFKRDAYFKDPRTGAIIAGNAMKAIAKSYERSGNAISSRIAALELNSPGANDRISEVLFAKKDARQALLDKMSPEEASLANVLHHYWSTLGDVLVRSGMTKTAIENYIPLMRMKEPLRVAGRAPRNYPTRSVHQIARQKAEDGSTLFQSPDELQAWADKKGLDWVIQKDVGALFKAHGNGVTTALQMRSAISQFKNMEVQVGKTAAETAAPVLTEREMRNNEVASEYSDRYVRATSMIGGWRNALRTRTGEDYWVHKPLAEVMEREAPRDEMPENLLTSVANRINQTNQIWKQWQFFYTPMHWFSLMGNVTSHLGLNPLAAGHIIRDGGDIVNNPMRGQDYNLLTRAGGADDPQEMKSIQANIPTYKGFHDFIWKTTMYNGTYGLGHHLFKQGLASYAASHPGEVMTPADRFDIARSAMDASRKAMGSLNRLDMSKNWGLWGNVAFLANKWTTGQLRTVGEALNLGPLARLGGAVPLEGNTPKMTQWMQRRQMAMSQRLIVGGMVRLAVVGTIASTAISAMLNNGVASTPFDNFQKDPAHTFDIYAGRDAVTGKDMWYRMPLYLFQREMVDWVMSAAKAQQEGKGLVDTNNLGDSILAAPFVKFAGKLDPITKVTLESLTGTELAGWMKGFSNSQIDNDTYILNLNKSLQTLGVPDGGSLENRLLNGIRQVVPSLAFPTNLKAPTSDIGQIMGALGIGIGPFSAQTLGGDVGAGIAPFVGSGQMQGTTYKQGPDGKIQPAWQIQNYYDNQTQLGQQILKIAATLGTGNAQEETQKLQQMESLRQQAGFSPGTLTNLILHGDSQPIPGAEKGILSLNVAPKPGVRAPAQLNGKELTPEQEVAYNSVTFQRQAQAIAQAVSDPTWKAMDSTERNAEISNLKAFADRITNQQFAIAMGTKKGNVVTTAQASSMIAEFGLIKRATQNGLLQSSIYTTAKPLDQANMMSDRVTAAQNAVWEKYYGTGALKNASDKTLTNYVALQSGLRDEARQLVQRLPSYSRSLDPAAQIQEEKLALTFADNLVNQAVQGKSPTGFSSPLDQQQLVVAVRNGIVLQDASLRELHNSFIYQEAPQADQLLLDSKYVTLAHNVALYDTRVGTQEGGIGDNSNFNSILHTTLAADEGYQTLVEQFFGTGGRVVLAQRESELAGLKARFRQENAIPPSELSRYDTMITNWYKQQNPDYANFIYYRAQWERYDPIGQAYLAMGQGNYGFEQTNPLALSTP